MKFEQLNYASELAAKARQLKVELVFAPVDFCAWLSSGRSHGEIEEYIAALERMPDDGSTNYRNNILQIAQYRAGTLILPMKDVMKKAD